MSILLCLLFNFCLSQASEVLPLGLVVKTQDTTVYRTTEITEVGIYFKIDGTYADYTQVLTEIEEHIVKLENIPALSATGNSEQYKSLGHMLRDIRKEFVSIKTGLQTLDAYKDTSSTLT